MSPPFGLPYPLLPSVWCSAFAPGNARLETTGREAAEPSADAEAGPQRPFLGIPGAFRVFYGPQDRVESACVARSDKSPVALAVCEAGDREAEEPALDGPFSAVPGAAPRGVFGGSAGLA